MSKRRSKKSDTLEVRLEHEVKSALMRKAEAEGRSTSDVVRSFIDSYLADQPKEARSMLLTLWKPAAAIGAASIALMWAALAPAPSQAQPDLRNMFRMLDRNHDGVISMAEFMSDASDPAIEKMHHAHMTNTAADKKMTAAHAAMMKAAHGKASPQTLRSHFAQLDSNSDGKVTFEEFQAFHDRVKAAHAGR